MQAVAGTHPIHSGDVCESTGSYTSVPVSIGALGVTSMEAMLREAAGRDFCLPRCRRRCLRNSTISLYLPESNGPVSPSPAGNGMG